jgi:UDP-N-acetylmuramyl pentapeptide phosphotransferase/UDP-N-acetylglucosamine-1-phosphate transferase
MKKIIWSVILLLMVAGLIWTGQSLQKRTLYPHFIIRVPGALTLNYFGNGIEDEVRCEHLVTSMASASLLACPTGCTVESARCERKSSVERAKVFSNLPLDAPSVRVPNGVIVYRDPTHPELAEAACTESQRSSSQGSTKIYCSSAHQPRISPSVSASALGEETKKQGVMTGLLFLLISALAAGFACALILRYEHLHAHFSHDHTEGGPQKFHTEPTSRIGGVGVFFGLAMVGITALPFQVGFSMDQYGLLLLASLPAFLGGLTEDITKRVGVFPRLFLTMVSGALGVYLLGASLHRLDLPGVDGLLVWAPFAVVFTVFAIGGVANAINIIDGFNGLASGYGVLVLMALAWVAGEVGDLFLMTSALALMGALLGFLVWNYPVGKIFMGDGGAYLLGFLLAELSVLLVHRNPQVSPWFPLVLLIYPVFETIYSIYRRKIKGNFDFGQPDDKHLHTLIYKRLCRKLERTLHLKGLCNPLTATAVWLLQLIILAGAVLFYQQTQVLEMVAGLFCVCYVFLYGRLGRFAGTSSHQ